MISLIRLPKLSGPYRTQAFMFITGAIGLIAFAAVYGVGRWMGLWI
jgi:hypothetical protein